MTKLLFKTTWLFLLLGLLSNPVFTASLSQSDLPMSQPNFQGFVPEQRSRDERDEDPRLIRLMVHPSLSWVADQLLDDYQSEYPDSRFRIHQGTQEDLFDLLDDNYNFDLLLDGEIAEGMTLVSQGRATQTRVLAVGRVALWAPLESVRSLRVLSLRNDPIGLQHDSSPYHRAGKEVLERQELLESYRSRLTPMRLGQDLFTEVSEARLPAAFIEYQRLVQAGLEERREVLKMPRNHHGSITHSATLMQEGAEREEVLNFWEYLFSERADQILRQAGLE